METTSTVDRSTPLAVCRVENAEDCLSNSGHGTITIWSDHDTPGPTTQTQQAD